MADCLIYYPAGNQVKLPDIRSMPSYEYVTRLDDSVQGCISTITKTTCSYFSLYIIERERERESVGRVYQSLQSGAPRFCTFLTEGEGGTEGNIFSSFNSRDVPFSGRYLCIHLSMHTFTHLPFHKLTTSSIAIFTYSSIQTLTLWSRKKSSSTNCQVKGGAIKENIFEN